MELLLKLLQERAEAAREEQRGQWVTLVDAVCGAQGVAAIGSVSDEVLRLPLAEELCAGIEFWCNRCEPLEAVAAAGGAVGVLHV